MEARPCPIIEFFNGTKQMMVPLFQRQYEWSKPNWETLWDDLLERYDDTGGTLTHFTGAIVTSPARSVPVGVSKYLVIDGQQRLTTVALLLCAMRSLMEPGTPRYRKITRLLVNEDDADLDHYKLLPTQPDRPPFIALVEGKPEEAGEGRMFEAYTYFRRRLQAKHGEGETIDLERLANTLQDRLTVVTIHLSESDDPYLIFESLNAKGAPLTQADLIRNYLLLRVPATAQQEVYEKCWLPMQRLGDHLTEYMRQYLMLTGEEVSKSAIYSVLKRRLQSVSDSDVRGEIDAMRDAARLYARIVGVETDPRPPIAQRLARLRRWEVTTASPLILELLRRSAAGTASGEEVGQALDLIESFVVRRYVCSVPTNQLKNIFLALVKDLPAEGVPAWLTERLARGASGRRWPKDGEFRLNWQSWPAYLSPAARCKMVLETLEASFDHKEKVETASATVEHVMPQTLSPEWHEVLGPSAANIHERWLHCIGNLTLTGYNPELSNSSFQIKRELLGKSHFEMNRAISDEATWTGTQIEARGLALFERAAQLWPRPQAADDEEVTEDETDDEEEEHASVRGTVPATLRIHDVQVDVRSWAEVAKTVARHIASLGDKTFDHVASQMPKFLNPRRDGVPTDEQARSTAERCVRRDQPERRCDHALVSDRTASRRCGGRPVELSAPGRPRDRAERIGATSAALLERGA
jgi:hypothetical protein